MRRLYVNLSMVVGMLFMFALGASAQKVVYAAVAASDDGKGGIYELNTEDPHAAAPKLVCELKDMVMGGAMVVDETAGNKYYAMCADATSGNPTDFCLIDFNTGKTTKLGNASKVTSLCYDAINGIMYATALYTRMVDGVEQKGTDVFTVDLTNGTMTLAFSCPNHRILTAYFNGANPYGIGADGKIHIINIANKKISMSKAIYPKGKPSTATVVITENDPQGLIYDGSKFCWLGYATEKGAEKPICFWSTMGNVLTSATYAKVGNDGSLSIADGKMHFTGLTFDKTTSSLEPEDKSIKYYASVYEDVMGTYPTSGIFAIDPKNPYVKPTSNYADLDWVLAAAEAEGVYYAMGVDESGQTPTKFRSVNLETKVATELGKASKMADMAYDKKNKIMYAVAKSDTGTVISTVDLTNGALNVVSAIKGINPLGIAVDPNGKIYVLGEDGNLYTANLSENKLNFACKLSVAPVSYVQSLTYSNNKLYWLTKVTGGSSLSTINVATGKVTPIGDGKFGVVLTGLYVPEDRSEVDASGMKLVTIVTHGDILAIENPTSDPTLLETFYYDKNNNLVRSSVRGYRADDRTKLDPMKFTTYIYNEKGQLAKTFYRQYGSYDGAYTIYGEPKKEITYEYDEEGRLVRKNDYDNRDYFLYTWDGKNLVKEVNMRVRYGTDDEYYPIQTIIYSDFVEGVDNLPRRVDSEGAYVNHEYIGFNTYDERNNLTSYITYGYDEVTKKSKKDWTYDENGALIQSRKYKVKDNEFVIDPDQIVNYTTEGSKTTIKNDRSLIWTVETVQELSPETAPKNLTIVNKSEASSPNTYELTWENPDVMNMASPAFDIYRNGIYLARVTGKNSYVDKEVPNEIYTHDYFVQTVSDIEGGLAFGVSNVVVQENVKTELEGVTDIKCSDHKVADKITVTLSWNAPTGIYLPQSYNVYLGGFKKPSNSNSNGAILPILGTTYEADFGFAENTGNFSQKVDVEAVYAVGRIKTETMIDLNADHTHGSSIENNTDAPVIEINGNELLINGKYTALDIYNVNGMVVKRAGGESSVDMSSLSAGVYMIRVVKDGKVSTLKAVRK